MYLIHAGALLSRPAIICKVNVDWVPLN